MHFVAPSPLSSLSWPPNVQYFGSVDKFVSPFALSEVFSAKYPEGVENLMVLLFLLLLFDFWKWSGLRRQTVLIKSGSPAQAQGRSVHNGHHRHHGEFGDQPDRDDCLHRVWAQTRQQRAVRHVPRRHRGPLRSQHGCPHPFCPDRGYRRSGGHVGLLRAIKNLHLFNSPCFRFWPRPVFLKSFFPFEFGRFSPLLLDSWVATHPLDLKSAPSLCPIPPVSVM